MVDLKPPSPPLTKLRDVYVPLEQRDSQNVSLKPFLWETAKLLLVAKLSSLAGWVVGKQLQKNNIKIGKIPITGMGLGTFTGLFGAFYQGYFHWRKAKGTQLRVNDITSDLKTAMDPAYMEQELHKEQAITSGIQAILAQGKSAGHTETVAESRSEAASGRTA